MTVQGTLCNMCGKQFDKNDVEYGSYIHDNETGSEDFDLCEECTQKVLSLLMRHCKIQPFLDIEKLNESEDIHDDNSDFDFDGELNN